LGGYHVVLKIPVSETKPHSESDDDFNKTSFERESSITHSNY